MRFHIIYEEPVYNSPVKQWRIYNETKDKKEAESFEDRDDATMFLKQKASCQGDIIYIHDKNGNLDKKITRDGDHFRSN